MKDLLYHGICEQAAGNGNLQFFRVRHLGKLRVVINAKPVNEMLNRIRHKPPSIREVTQFLSDAKRVTVLDFVGFYHQFLISC